jgi:hypothetical protein
MWRGRLTLEGDIRDTEALVLTLGGRDDRRVADEGVVDTGVRNQISLELVEIDVESTIEAEGRGDRADDLGNKAVQMLIGRARNVEVATANVVHGLVIDKEGAVGVLDSAMGRENGVVGFDDGGRGTRGWVDGELELRLLAILGGKALKHESTEARAGTTTERVENQEALKRVAVVCANYQSVVLGSQAVIYGGKGWNQDLPATRRTRSMTLSTISLPMV